MRIRETGSISSFQRCAHTAANSDSHLCCLFSIVCVHAQSPLRYRTRIRTLLPFRPSLLGGVSCVYNRVQRSRLNGQPLNGQRNGHLHCARRSVEDMKIGPNGHMETRCFLTSSRTARAASILRCIRCSSLVCDKT